MAIGRVAVEKQSFIVADYRSVDPDHVKHAAAVDYHRRTVGAAFVVVGG